MHPQFKKAATALAITGLAVVLAMAMLPAPASAQQGDEPSATALLSRGAGYDQPQGSKRVQQLQIRLRAVGAQPGPVDGRFGPLTEAAVRRFQLRHGLPVDGIAGPSTDAALRRQMTTLTTGAGFAGAEGSQRVRTLQRQLRRAGFEPGAIDGRFGERTRAAVLRFQRRADLAADGIAGIRTRAALKRRLAEDTQPAEQQQPADQDQQQPVEQPQDQPADAGTTRQVAQKEPQGEGQDDQQLVGPAVEGPEDYKDELLVALAIAIALLGALFAVAVLRTGSPRPEPEAAGDDATTPPAPAVPVAAPARTAADRPRVLGYAALARRRGDPGDRDLQRQAQRILAECDRRGLVLEELVREHQSETGDRSARPGLAYAMERIKRREADGLVVTDPSILTESPAELGDVLAWFSEHGSKLIWVNEGVDSANGDRRRRS